MMIAGVDEAGRGPLAGPVYAAAVILDPKKRFRCLRDSKMLNHKQRETLFDQICEKAVAWSIAYADVHEIDSINILQASLLAMRRAVAALAVLPVKILVDGNVHPRFESHAKDAVELIVDGDKKIREISAASILAKVARDRVMIDFENQYPGYGFAQHKGYSTEEHLLALKKMGPCEIHRRSFTPVRVLLGVNERAGTEIERAGTGTGPYSILGKSEPKNRRGWSPCQPEKISSEIISEKNAPANRRGRSPCRPEKISSEIVKENNYLLLQE